MPENVLRCRECPLRATCRRVVASSGEGDFLVVLDAPDAEQEGAGEFRAGLKGRIIQRLMMSANILNYAITGVVRCRPPNDRVAYAGEIATCKKWLKKELVERRPTVLITMGRMPAKLLLKGAGEFRLEDHLYKAHRADYGDYLVVPLPSVETIMRGRRDVVVKNSVRALIKARNYNEVRQHRHRGDGAEPGSLPNP